jgi:hypothetical protein
MTSFWVSVDLGQSHDYTAITVIEVVKSESRERDGNIVHLERLTLGMSYPDQVQRIKELQERIPDSRIVVDSTGVGRAVIDLMRKEGLRPVAITITGGNEANKEGLRWNVPKRDLVYALRVGIESGKIKIAKSLIHAELLEKELQNFKMKQHLQTGHDTYEAWREGDHDDLVLSASMAAYAADIGKREPVFAVACCNRN